MEQERTVDGVKTAIQMEIDGKAYYEKISRESSNPAGKKLLASLAEEEDIHRRKFEQIYESIRSKKGWGAVDYKPDEGSALRTLFARAAREVGTATKAPRTELDAVATAMDMENKTYDFYTRRVAEASSPEEKEFYAAVAAQEKQHHIVLFDYHEYMRDPAQYNVMKERHSLDGG